MKVGYVVPRYGLEIIGGAEYACRMFAERLVARSVDVEVFTTCAIDPQTWADHYTAGAVDINGVRVHRFASRAGRSERFHDFASQLLAAPEAASMGAAEQFIELQGPVCPEVVAAAAASDADLLVFYPYLYFPTVRGVPAAGARALMHPAAHDEPALRLPVFDELFHAVSGLVLQTEAERRLCRERFGIRRRPRSIVLGLGVDPVVDPGLAPETAGLDGAPFVLALGRLEDGKGTTMLAEAFARYKQVRPGPLKLVLAGPVVQAPPVHPDVLVPGAVSETEKAALLHACTALVQPSYFEAFSLVLLEGWTAAKPAIVNGHCGPLREHVIRSRAGACFTDDTSLFEALDRAVGDDRWRRRLGGRGARYAARHFSWDRVMDRYERFLTKVARRARRRT